MILWSALLKRDLSVLLLRMKVCNVFKACAFRTLSLPTAPDTSMSTDEMAAAITSGMSDDSQGLAAATAQVEGMPDDVVTEVMDVALTTLTQNDASLMTIDDISSSAQTIADVSGAE